MIQPGDRVMIFEDPFDQQVVEGEAAVVKCYGVDWFADPEGFVDLSVKFDDDCLVVRRRKLVRRTVAGFATVGNHNYPLSEHL